MLVPARSQWGPAVTRSPTRPLQPNSSSWQFSSCKNYWCGKFSHSRIHPMWENIPHQLLAKLTSHHVCVKKSHESAHAGVTADLIRERTASAERQSGMSKAATTPRPGEPQPALMRALKRLLRPLVRVLIPQGITLPTLLRPLKEVYVDVGESQFVVPGRQQTDSRINLLTGVHRKDIRALRGRGRPDEGPSPVVSRNAQMIALWAGDPEFVDRRGRPRPLPRNAPKSGGASFEGLVR